MVYLRINRNKPGDRLESSRYDTERNLDEDMLPSCGSGMLCWKVCLLLKYSTMLLWQCELDKRPVSAKMWFRELQRVISRMLCW